MRTAFVIPWFGPDLVGGAEQHIFQVATRLAGRGHSIEVLTTCCRSFRDDWEVNHLPEGASEYGGVIVRRFAVAPRNRDAFGAANAALLKLNEIPKAQGTSPVPAAVARTFVEESIRSPRLLEYIERERDAYDSIVFSPYLYGPTLLGIPLAGRRAVLQPLLHDEAYAYLPQVERVFHAARRVLFISEGEARLAERLFGPSMWRKGVVTGAGVESAAAKRDERTACATPTRPFVLYLGRRDPVKGTTFLLNAFRRFRAAHPDSALQLVLAGNGALRADEIATSGIVDAGLVSADEKEALLRECRALAQPSRNESYSRTMLEAWLHGKPVVVHAECLATKIPVESTGGGWSCATEEEWAEVLSRIAAAAEQDLATRGERGRLYAQDHADWDRAIDRYERTLSVDAPRSPTRRRRRSTRAVHQLLPNLSYGDAISNQAALVCELLREFGYESEIFVQYIDDQMLEVGRPFQPGVLRPQDALLYHHSIGTTLTETAVRHPGPKALVYHNITPPRFYQRWDDSFARLLESGRAALATLAPAFPISVGDSGYNAAELRECGFSDPGVLPIFVEPLRWAQPAEPRWMEVLQDGRSNLLFVGRMAPNKCQHQLLEAFAEYLAFDPDARLVMVGGWRDGDPYANFVRGLVHSLGIASSVVVARGSSDAELLACYRTADLFWSMSEHEGFCVPLVEAMWFDIPVLAYRAAAVPETLGEAGVLFTEKRLPELAALAHLLVEDQALRARVVATQKARRRTYLPEFVLPAFVDLLEKLTGGAQHARAAS